jgi:hypothetical protein
VHLMQDSAIPCRAAHCRHSLQALHAAPRNSIWPVPSPGDLMQGSSSFAFVKSGFQPHGPQSSISSQFCSQRSKLLAQSARVAFACARAAVIFVSQFLRSA